MKPNLIEPYHLDRRQSFYPLPSHGSGIPESPSRPDEVPLKTGLDGAINKMTLDIRGGLKNIAINKSDHAVFEEMLSNAIDSYLVRRNEDKDAPPFEVKIHIEIIATTLFGDGFDVDLSCTDNGAGFGDEQVKAFITMDSTYKDRLSIQGIGKCKGAGRIQFFHHFDRFSLDSVFKRGDGVFRRTLSMDATTQEISEPSFTEAPAPHAELSTTVS